MDRIAALAGSRKVVLHDGSPHTLGVLRVVVFALLGVYVATLDLAFAGAPGLRLALRAALLLALAWCVLGLRPFRAVALAASVLCAAVVLAAGVQPLDLGPIALLLAAVMLALAPSADLVSPGRARPLRARTLYARWLMAIAGVVATCLALAGVLRLASHGLEDPLATARGVLETLAPLALVLPRWRRAWTFALVLVVLASAFPPPADAESLRDALRDALLIALLFADANALFTPRPGRDAVPVLFFDGECGLCNRAAKFFLERDVDHVLGLAPLQGETAAARLPAALRGARLDTVVLIDERGIHERSSAVLRALKRLGGLHALVAPLLLLVPRALRERAYDFVARNRFAWFGRVESCSIVPPAVRARILP